MMRRVLHIGREVAGNMRRICDYMNAHRDMGDEYKCINYYTSGALNYQCDVNLALDKLPPKEQSKVRLKLLMDEAPKYDVFCFHFLETFLPDMSDLSMLKDMGKKIVFFFWGSDARAPEFIYWYQMRFHGLEVDRPFTWSRDRYERIVQADRYADIIYGFEGLPRRVSFYGMIDTAQFTDRKIQDNGRRPLKIVHSVRPDAKQIKGTPWIIDVVQSCIKDGLEIQFDLVSGVSPEEAKQRYREADLIIDQIGGGYMGAFAYEGLALGKPVITYQHDDYNQMMGKYSPILIVKSMVELKQEIEHIYNMTELQYLALCNHGRSWVEGHRCINVWGKELAVHVSMIMQEENVPHDINLQWKEDEEKMRMGIKSRFYKDAIAHKWFPEGIRYDKELYV